MGCYGIGVNRILASLIETSHDNDGIIWPVSISPFEVVIVPLKIDDPELKSVAFDIYDKLRSSGIDVLLDDRDKTPGVKFKDADLVGFPVQVVVGSKHLVNGNIEIKLRYSGKKELVRKEDAAKHIIENVRKLYNR
jgi:prolyl-tRNA synthetase